MRSYLAGNITFDIIVFVCLICLSKSFGNIWADKSPKSSTIVLVLFKWLLLMYHIYVLNRDSHH